MSSPTAAAAPAKPAKRVKRNRLSGGFFRFVLTRFLLIIPTVFILVTVVFFVMRATGDPISTALGGRLAPDELQRRIHAAGYDRPIIVQYIDYLGGLLHGDLGTTMTDNQPVISILTRYGAATLELAILALIIALLVGNILSTPMRTVRHQFPAYAGYYSPGLAFKLIFYNQLLRTITMIGVTWAYWLCAIA